MKERIYSVFNEKKSLGYSYDAFWWCTFMDIILMFSRSSIGQLLAYSLSTTNNCCGKVRKNIQETFP
jgi:hypothetical protein